MARGRQVSSWLRLIGWTAPVNPRQKEGTLLCTYYDIVLQLQRASAEDQVARRPNPGNPQQSPKTIVIFRKRIPVGHAISNEQPAGTICHESSLTEPKIDTRGVRQRITQATIEACTGLALRWWYRAASRQGQNERKKGREKGTGG